tara:strand:+ start:22 stop:303 length:282 start_codon:yes stop_codon:yes gene_type:complete
MDKVYIAKKTVIPEDDERYTIILGVFAEKEDASVMVKKLLTEVLEDIDVSYDFSSNIEELQNKITTEWIPKWAAPRFEITSHEVQKGGNENGQ